MSRTDAPRADPEAAPPWAERDAAARRATLDGLLAQISREALQGDGLEAVLQGIVDSLARQLPVAIASILLTDDTGTLFLQEVWAGSLDLAEPPETKTSETFVSCCCSKKWMELLNS